MSTKTRYDLSQIVLHWLIAILIGANYLLGDAMSDAFKALVRAAIALNRPGPAKP